MKWNGIASKLPQRDGTQLMKQEENISKLTQRDGAQLVGRMPKYNFKDNGTWKQICPTWKQSTWKWKC